MALRSICERVTYCVSPSIESALIRVLQGLLGESQLLWVLRG